ncbi:hypothetical protein CJP74_02010 [Psittacicella melopsittaci]|uniref:Uncharacterized protein n=1 Tax=Psittacicella melopsittaci TaxID=2028576 RepID=A0A3A1Y6Z8_9GAMM|nr:hypothetical protein [Psittacicella melopsittaci]RIY33385.1 hypothetical protein CJP74_02010 [Psittacicella melopsittaci]
MSKNNLQSNSVTLASEEVATIGQPLGQEVNNIKIEDDFVLPDLPSSFSSLLEVNLSNLEGKSHKQFRLPELKDISPYVLTCVESGSETALSSLRSLANLIPQGIIVFLPAVGGVEEDDTLALLKQFCFINSGYKLLTYPFAAIPENYPELETYLYKGTSRYWLSDAVWNYALEHLRILTKVQGTEDKAWVLKTNSQTIFDPLSVAYLFEYICRSYGKYQVYQPYAFKVSAQGDINFISCSLQAGEFFAPLASISKFDFKIDRDGRKNRVISQAYPVFKENTALCTRKYFVLGVNFVTNYQGASVKLGDCNWQNLSKQVPEVVNHLDFYSEAYLKQVAHTFRKVKAQASFAQFNLAELFKQEDYRPEIVAKRLNKQRNEYEVSGQKRNNLEFFIDFNVISRILADEYLDKIKYSNNTL